MTPFVFHPEAEQDIDSAAVWYDARQPGLGRQFREASGQAMAAIERNPHAHARVKGPYRRFAMTRFPYNIVYWPLANAIYILAVSHSHRDPKHWRKRL